ncbi:AMP-binding protein [Candidatus Pelagibacter sp.]|nr:AMP-binding protein [Candidatus Pelagibacter sp.]
MYVSILAVLITNNIWIPLSKSLPKKRVQDILKDVQPDMFLCDNFDDHSAFEKYTNNIFNFEQVKKAKFFSNKLYLPDLIKKISLNDIAFIYFTSGSTGEAKGIKISHVNIISDIFEQKKHLYNFDNIKNHKNLVFGDYYDTAFSIFFDIFFPAIYMGAAISPAKTKGEIMLPINHLKKNKINILVAVPSTVQRIKMYYGNKKIKHPLKVLIMTGEPFYLNILDYIFKTFNTEKIYNCYGGTEMSNWVYYHDCKKSDLKKYKTFNLVPIGKKFSTVKSKIIKDELIVSGPMISLGYIKKKLNKNRFILKKYCSTFFTGDLVEKKYGNIICKGRKDAQIKIRGYRIEIPYVEAKLRAIKYVEQCIVVQKKIQNYDNHLVAVMKLNKKISDSKIRDLASKELPQYMIPSKFTIKNRIPLNSNGKIDRKKIANAI